MSDAISHKNKAPLTVIHGGRAHLERALLETIFTPGPMSENKYHCLMDQLAPRAHCVSLVTTEPKSLHLKGAAQD